MEIWCSRILAIDDSPDAIRFKDIETFCSIDVSNEHFGSSIWMLVYTIQITIIVGGESLRARKSARYAELREELSCFSIVVWTHQWKWICCLPSRKAPSSARWSLTR